MPQEPKQQKSETLRAIPCDVAAEAAVLGSMMMDPQCIGDVVQKLDKDGKESVAYMDTNTGGSVSINSKGAMFVVQRGLNQAVWQLAPERKLLPGVQ